MYNYPPNITPATSKVCTLQLYCNVLHIQTKRVQSKLPQNKMAINVTENKG